MVRHEDVRIQNCTYLGEDVPKVPILDFAESWKGGALPRKLEARILQAASPKGSM